MGRPIQKVGRFSNLPVVVCCGAISAQGGAVHYQLGYRSFNAQDMQEVLRQLR